MKNAARNGLQHLWYVICRTRNEFRKLFYVKWHNGYSHWRWHKHTFSSHNFKRNLLKSHLKLHRIAKAVGRKRQTTFLSWLRAALHSIQTMFFTFRSMANTWPYSFNSSLTMWFHIQKNQPHNIDYYFLYLNANYLSCFLVFFFFLVSMQMHSNALKYQWYFIMDVRFVCCLFGWFHRNAMKRNRTKSTKILYRIGHFTLAVSFGEIRQFDVMNDEYENYDELWPGKRKKKEKKKQKREPKLH